MPLLIINNSHNNSTTQRLESVCNLLSVSSMINNREFLCNQQ